MSEILLDEIVSDLGGEAPLRRLGLSMGDIRLVKAMICGDVTSLPPEYQKHKWVLASAPVPVLCPRLHLLLLLLMKSAQMRSSLLEGSLSPWLVTSLPALCREGTCSAS